MSLDAALAARIVAALAFALVAAASAVAAPAWALVLLAVAGAGVFLARPGHDAQNAVTFDSSAVGFCIGLVLTAGMMGLFGAAGGLAALVIWRAGAEAAATEQMLRDIARMNRPDTLDRGLVRTAHLLAGPMIALGLFFSVHGGAVFGQATFTLPLEISGAVIGLGCVGLIDWTIRRLADWRMGTASRALTLHVGAHHVLFLALGAFSTDGAAMIAGLLAWRILRFAPPLPGLPTIAQKKRSPRPYRKPGARAVQARVVAR